MAETPADTDKLVQYDTFAPENDNKSEKPSHKSQRSKSLWKCTMILIINSIPNIVHFAAGFIMQAMSLHFLSKSGNVAEIAGTGLGNTWMNATNTWMNATNTLIISAFNMGTVVYCAPAFGAKNYYLVGLCFQAFSSATSLFCSHTHYLQR